MVSYIKNYVYATIIRILCYFLVTRLGAYSQRLGAYATLLGVYATWAIPRGSFDPKKRENLGKFPKLEGGGK